VQNARDKGGEVEFVTDVAECIPLQMICDMLGVPEEDHHLIFSWSNRMVGMQDPDFRNTPEDGELAAAEIFAYCDGLVDDRRARPRDDILSVLVHAEIDGDRLSREEIDAFFVLLCVAGNETTRNLISHAMLALIEHPASYRELVDGIGDDGLWRTATEEFLRWGSSIHNFRRTATRDTEIRGQRIGAGDKVVTFYMSANHDEEVFPDPYVFDIRRTPNDHVTFGGGGPHFCLGANLARLEITCMIRELLRRFPSAELTGPVRRMRSDFINGIKHMPVRLGGGGGQAPAVGWAVPPGPPPWPPPGPRVGRRGRHFSRALAILGSLVWRLRKPLLVGSTAPLSFMQVRNACMAELSAPPP
jgi:cholest-4-en-3-one 26-monooxygenase